MAIKYLSNLKIENEIDGSVTHLFDVDGVIFGVVISGEAKHVVDKDYAVSNAYQVADFPLPA
ncbi:hypothetical protein [Klebsiella quasipneumoniae]|uniref:Uncharacterized protein n=1 Tax=Klebsiella pneumoniae TaxID=573 RepID=A0A377Y589_KLEPN|nr:hypothetical protein [Klebsiella quasipneumoniae]EKW2092115.1 hypothetical protein [Klebsiella variicola]PLK93898.1 hypothetical protein CWN39_25115 [Klebsiella pneumoniae]STT96205.1 Uncharacterised protein [Klebsiella pneumoniae]